ncbi:transcriptional regulator ATRX-like [Dromiciops gliroides]|uniref:transcriptional regulator ATRX-like n=1 Tax=Dromiciops gliroides TaxID=33562 RepID=UPI001CC5A298|nr:transcriptional regulator ATRX-like [Dromiciops gliroides]
MSGAGSSRSPGSAATPDSATLFQYSPLLFSTPAFNEENPEDPASASVSECEGGTENSSQLMAALGKPPASGTSRDLSPSGRGNEFVQLEAVQKEDKDDFQEPEVSEKSTIKTETLKKEVGKKLHRILDCTACGQQVNCFQKDSVYRHPALNVLICKNCYEYYISGDISRDSRGIDEQCRWCAKGGSLICCDSCYKAFCNKCIWRNLGQKEISKIMDENNQWNCYICHPEPLLDLITVCDSVFEKFSCLMQQNKTMLQFASEESGKTYNCSQKFHSSIKGRSNAEKKLRSVDSYSDSITYSFSSLKIPDDLIKKTKKLVENTTKMNASVTEFLEQTISNPTVASGMKLSQLKAIRSVIVGISKAHKALEKLMGKEISNLVVRNKEENIRKRKNENVKKDAKLKNVNVKSKVKNKVAMKTKFSHDKTDTEMVRRAINRETRKCNTNEELQYEPACTSKSVDIEVVSIHSSGSEDNFENLETCVSTKDAECTESNTDNCPLKTDESSKVGKRESELETLTRITRKLCVALSPISISDSSSKDTVNQEKTEEEYHQEASITGNIEVIKEKITITDNDTMLFGEETDLQRSRQIKTIPFIEQIEKEFVTSSSEEESDEKCIAKSSGQWKKKDSQSFLPHAEENVQLISKEYTIMIHSSDSDERSVMCKESAKVNKSSSESDTDFSFSRIRRKVIYRPKSHMFKQDKAKPKREDSTSDSGTDAKKTSKFSIAKNAKKQQFVKYLFSSSSDNDESAITVRENADAANTGYFQSSEIFGKSRLEFDSDSEETKKLKYRCRLFTYDRDTSDGESVEETNESKHSNKRKVSPGDSIHSDFQGHEVTEDITESEDDQQPRSAKIIEVEDNQKSYKQKKKRKYIQLQEDSSSENNMKKDCTALTKVLPPKYEYVLAVRMTSLQCKLYQCYLDHITGTGSTSEGERRKLFQDLEMLSRIWTHPWCLKLDYIGKEKKGYFDDCSMEEFIPADSDETSGSLSSDDFPKKKKFKGKKNISSSGSDDVKVIEVRHSRYRRGGKGNEYKLASNSSVTLRQEEKRATYPGSLSADWYKDFITDSDAKVLEHSGKMVLLLEILKMSEELGDKVLVFSQALISLDLIEYFLELGNKELSGDENNSQIYKGEGKWFRNIDYYRLDGSTTVKSRKKWAREFNDKTNLRGRLFIISTKTESLGIKLVAANRIIIFDGSWNPSYAIQSISRVYCFGQNKPVYVYRFLAQGTMEDKLYEYQVRKQSLFFPVFDQQQIERHFTVKELTELYTFEPDLLDDPNSEKEEKRDTSMLPKDTILAELLQVHKEYIVGYHEHDSLLDHEEEELSVEEREAAWRKFEAEKKDLTMHITLPSEPLFFPADMVVTSSSDGCQQLETHE